MNRYYHCHQCWAENVVEDARCRRCGANYESPAVVPLGRARKRFLREITSAPTEATPHPVGALLSMVGGAGLGALIGAATAVQICESTDLFGLSCLETAGPGGVLGALIGAVIGSGLFLGVTIMSADQRQRNGQDDPTSDTGHRQALRR